MSLAPAVQNLLAPSSSFSENPIHYEGNEVWAMQCFSVIFGRFLSLRSKNVFKLYNEAQQDAKVAQTTLTYILTVHRNEKNKYK